MNIFSLLNVVTPSLTIQINDLSGNPTGESLTLRNPSSGIMTRAFELYLRELNRIKRDNKALLDLGNETQDFSEYNAIAAPAIARLDAAFAVSAVEGWTLDDEATEVAIEGLLGALPYLVDEIVAAEWRAKAQVQKK